MLLLAAVVASVFCGAGGVTQAQATFLPSFLPSSRTIDWTHIGIPGGIPDAKWPICQTSIVILTVISTNYDAVEVGNLIQRRAGHVEGFFRPFLDR